MSHTQKTAVLPEVKRYPSATHNVGFYLLFLPSPVTPKHVPSQPVPLEEGGVEVCGLLEQSEGRRPCLWQGVGT